MTLEERKERFFKFHGQLFGRVKRTDMWEDLLDLIRAHDPARELVNVPVDNVKIPECSPFLLGNSRGFNVAIATLESLKQDDGAEQPPEAKFEETPI